LIIFFLSGFNAIIVFSELVRSNQSHPVGNRTPRIPVVVPRDRSATDDATSELKNAISSTKKNNDGVSNDCANFSINEFYLDGRSRIMESTKGVEYQTFLKTKGTGDTEIFQNHQPLKRKGMDHIMDRGQTSKVGHETLMEVREGNKSVGLLKAVQMFDEYISSGIFFYGTLYSVVIIYNSSYQIYLTTSCDQDILEKPELVHTSHQTFS
jgi:hypothetical protein